MHIQGYGRVDDEGAVERVAEILRSARRVLLTTHLSPDGDGVGGVLALALLLRSRGVEVLAYLRDPVPYNLNFLPGREQIVHEIPETARFDATCVLDTNAEALIGALPPRERLGTVVLIDHHRKQEPFADVAFIDPESASVGEMLYRLAKKLPARLTRDIAKNIYCSIFCDTGGFRYSSTNPMAFRVAAEMLELGVDAWEMTSHLQESHPAARQHLLGEVLRTLTLSDDGRCAAIFLSREMFSRWGASEELTDGFINFARGIAGVEVAVQFLEREPGGYQVSFRSRGRVDVSQIARALGGGGKRRAAGCRLEGQPAALLTRVFALSSACCAASLSSGD